MELIPGLPNDLARECLVRVSYEQFSTMASVCKGWKAELESPDFRRQRKSTGNSQVSIVLAMARPNPNSKFSSHKHYLPPVYLPVVFDPISGRWAHLPAPPTAHNVLPFFCRFATAGSNLVVMGGFDPVSWDVLTSVHIFSFLTDTWRRGADMPGPSRSFFCCATDQGRSQNLDSVLASDNGSCFVYVAGGHDNSKKALRSAMTYDVERDVWVPMPDMGAERDECGAMFRDGKFHVISGFPTERQGKFKRSVEAFDPTTWRWGPAVNLLEPEVLGPAVCVDGTGEEYMYMCRDCHVVVLRNLTWQGVAQLPNDLESPVHMMRWQGKMTIFGPGSGKKNSHVAYTLDLQSVTWTKVEAPDEFSSQIMEGACLEF